MINLITFAWRPRGGAPENRAGPVTGRSHWPDCRGHEPTGWRPVPHTTAGTEPGRYRARPTRGSAATETTGAEPGRCIRRIGTPVRSAGKAGALPYSGRAVISLCGPRRDVRGRGPSPADDSCDA